MNNAYMRQAKPMLLICIAFTLLEFGDAALTVSSVSESSGDLTFDFSVTESSGTVSATIDYYTVNGNAYELASISEISADLTINNLTLTYEMEFQDPVDNIREALYDWDNPPSYGSAQSISSAYAQTLINELSNNGGSSTSGSHKGNLNCNFGPGTYGRVYATLASDGNGVSFSSTETNSNYVWSVSTIESTYGYWFRVINPSAPNCALSGVLQWGIDDTSLYGSRKRWTIVYEASGGYHHACPSTGYARSITSNLTGITTGTCTSPSEGGTNMCKCGNCQNGDYDGTGYCVGYQHFTGWVEASGKYAMYDGDDQHAAASSSNMKAWASYTGPGSVESSSGSHTTLDIQVGSGSTNTYNLGIDGSLTTSAVSYDSNIRSFFNASSGHRLIIPDIGVYGSNPSSTDFVVIPANLFDTEHLCGSVLVDAVEWFIGSHNGLTTASNTVNSAQCSDSIGTNYFCTNDHNTCLNNTLNNWLTWGQLDRSDIAFPGFDFLNIGGSYTSRITVAASSGGTPDSYAETNVDLSLQYGFNNALSYAFTIDESTIAYKEPVIGTVSLDADSAQTTSEAFTLDIDVTNSGDASGDFYVYASCDSGTSEYPTYESSRTTIAAGATATITTQIPTTDCLKDDFDNISPYSFTVSYDALPLWSTKVESPQNNIHPATDEPTEAPTTDQPTEAPTTDQPTVTPSCSPTTAQPTVSPSYVPSTAPSVQPSDAPQTAAPTNAPVTPIPSENSISNPPSIAPSHMPVTSDPTCNPTTALPTRVPSVQPTTGKPSWMPTRLPSLSPIHTPTTAPTRVPSAQPRVFDESCTNVEMYIVQGGNSNVLEHQATCIDRPEGSYVIDIDTSTPYIVSIYNAADEQDEQTHTAIYNCDQDTGVQTSSVTASQLINHNIVFVSNWAETAAYFGSVYDPLDPLSTTVRFRLAGFDLNNYPEGSTQRSNLKIKIRESICSLNTGADSCEQFSIDNLVAGSIIVVLNIDASDNDGTKLIDIQKNIQNEIASYNSDPYAEPDPNNPLSNLDRFYWNNKQYQVIFTLCPANQYITLADGETEATISWTEPTAEFTSGASVTPERVEGASIVNGENKPVGSYYFRYTAHMNNDFALPCTFFIQITSDEVPEASVEQMVVWMTNEVMLISAVVCSLLGICTFIACWKKFGVRVDDKEGFTDTVPKQESSKTKRKKKGKKTKVELDLESDSSSS